MDLPHDSICPGSERSSVIPRVLLVGISTRALSHSAAAAGWQVTSLDLFGDRDHPPGTKVYSVVRDFGLAPELANLARAAAGLVEAVDAVVIEGGLENEPLLHQVRHPRRTWNNPPEVVARARDADRLRAALQGTGCQLPETWRRGDSLPRSGKLLVKDRLRSGGAGVSQWNGVAPLQPWEELQAYIPGELASACFLSDGRKSVLLGMSRQYAGVSQLGARPFIWCGNCAPLINSHVREVVEQACTAISLACGLVGLNGFDFIIRDEIPYLLEVNPRPPASFELFERLLGVNAFRLHVDACQGRLPQRLPQMPASSCWGKAILYAPKSVVIGDTVNWHDRGIADIPYPGELIPKGAPICTLLGSSDHPDACWQALLARASSILAECIPR